MQKLSQIAIDSPSNLEYESNYSRVTIYQVGEDYYEKRDEIEAFVIENHPATRCQHDYDCCGNFYARPAHWGVIGGMLVVTQQFVENI